MSRRARLSACALSLAHFLAALLLLRAGWQWGYLDSPGAWLLHMVLFPGWLVYLACGPDNLFSLIVAYPLNSLLWGFGMVWLRSRFIPGKRAGRT